MVDTRPPTPKQPDRPTPPVSWRERYDRSYASHCCWRGIRFAGDDLVRGIVLGREVPFRFRST